MNKEGMGGCIVPSGNCCENSSCMLISLLVTDSKAGLPSPERWMVWVKWVTLGECFPPAIVWYELFIAVAYYQLYKQNLQVLCEWWQVLVNKNALKMECHFCGIRCIKHAPGLWLVKIAYLWGMFLQLYSVFCIIHHQKTYRIEVQKLMRFMLSVCLDDFSQSVSCVLIVGIAIRLCATWYTYWLFWNHSDCPLM